MVDGAISSSCIIIICYGPAPRSMFVEWPLDAVNVEHVAVEMSNLSNLSSSLLKSRYTPLPSLVG